MECLHLSFSCQGRGSSTFSLACIGSMCLKQRFPGGHSLRLAFWSFMIIYRRILAVLLSVKFSLSSLCWLTLGSVRSLLPRNFGLQSCRHARLGDDGGFSVRVSSTIILRGSKHLQQLGGISFCETNRLWFCIHTQCWCSTLGRTALWFRLTPLHVPFALASLGVCVIVPSGFVDSPSLLQGKRCWLLVAFERRPDCGFALTPTAGSQLSIRPRYDFDLHLYMFYLHLAVANFTRRLHAWLGTLRNRVSVA